MNVYRWIKPNANIQIYNDDFRQSVTGQHLFQADTNPLINALAKQHIMSYWFYRCILLGIFMLASIGEASTSTGSIEKSAKKPKWEVGTITSYATLPHYPGSNHRSEYFIPVIPFFIYRFKNFSLNRSSLSKRLNIRTELRLAAGLRVPVDSAPLSAKKPTADIVNTKTNYHRRGMDDRDLLIKLGIQVKYRINPYLTASLPLLLNMNVKHFGRYEGYEINPELSVYLFKNPHDIKTELFFTWSYADTKINDYFYQVKTNEALADRPSYQAKAGEIERTVGLSVRHNVNKKFSYFLSWRYHNYRHSANRASPLHVINNQRSFIAGVSYLFFSSSNTVNRYP